LTPGERQLALRALAWLVVMRVALRTISFTSIRRYVESRSGSSAIADVDWPRAVRRAGQRAARTLPGSSCLARSLVGELLLRQGGHPATLRIGVAALPMTDPLGTTRADLEAHAWVESDGLLVAGDGDLDRYTELARFGDGG
jgi:hypothetical protein